MAKDKVQEAINKANILIEALPYIKRFYGKPIVIKYGGHALTNRKKRLAVLEDIIFMSYAGMKPVIVHGGGPYINKKMKQKRIASKFMDGLRVTGEAELVVIREVLKTVNDRIVSEIKALGGRAKGLSGTEIIKVRRRKNFKELGYVGDITDVSTELLEPLFEKDTVPVISPLGLGRDMHVYNINADQAGAAVAKALRAEKIAILTNVDGIYRDIDDANSLFSSLTVSQAAGYIKRRVIGTGMIPKVKACVSALKGGVGKAHIINGTLPHALLLEIFTDKGIGTQMVK